MVSISSVPPERLTTSITVSSAPSAIPRAPPCRDTGARPTPLSCAPAAPCSARHPALPCKHRLLHGNPPNSPLPVPGIFPGNSPLQLVRAGAAHTVGHHFTTAPQGSAGPKGPRGTREENGEGGGDAPRAVGGRAEALPVQELRGGVRLRGKVWGRFTRPEREKGKDRMGGSLCVAREENVKDGQLAGSMHHLAGEWAGRGKVGPWCICPSPVG